MAAFRLIDISIGITVLQLFSSFNLLPPSHRVPLQTVALNVSHVVGETVLNLEAVTYENNLGQDFTIEKFKYYISNIVLKQNNGPEHSCDAYFLVNESDESSKHLLLHDVPKGNYSAIDFIVGVDSLHNCSGAQSGALDPVNAMFWAWNTGYIFLKLEGKSSFSASPGHFFEFHIGGYKQPNNCIRRIHLDLNNGEFAQAHPTIYLEVDLLEILKNPQTIDFSKLSSVTDFHNATLIADNYTDMFSIQAGGKKN